MDVSQAVAFTGVVIYLTAFGFYNKQIITGHSKPNVATWLLWACLAVLNAATYQVMTGDWVMTIQAYGGSVANVGTFLFALKTGKLSKLDRRNQRLLVLGLSAIGIWWISRNATYANLVLQICIFISIVPTWSDVWRDPATERSLPWFMFGGSYVFAIAVVAMRWQGQIQDLVFPINAGVIQLVVALLALRKSRTTSTE